MEFAHGANRGRLAQPPGGAGNLLQALVGPQPAARVARVSAFPKDALAREAPRSSGPPLKSNRKGASLKLWEKGP